MSDSVRITRNSVQFDQLGLVVSPNTKKNDRNNTSYHQAFIPYITERGKIDVGSMFELYFYEVKSRRMFLFVDDNGKLLTSRKMMDHARQFYKKNDIDPISVKTLRKYAATNHLENNSADTVDVMMGWRSRFAQSFYITTNKTFRFQQSAKL